MKKVFLAASVFLFMAVSALPVNADLGDFISNVNVEARADIEDFQADLSARFGVPLPQVRAIVRSVDQPADAFVCIRLGEMSNNSLDVVLRTYEANRNKGWGAIAKQLGIRPGSSKFNALKRGDFVFAGAHGASKGHGHGKARGKSKKNKH